MVNESPLIAILVAGIGLAFLLGALAHRLRMAPIAGYLVAGVVVGPYTPGFVADQNLASQLADLGIILLMFGVGLHFSLQDLLAVRWVALPGAVIQIAVSTALGTGVAWLLGWDLDAGIVFGLALSVSSTVVITRALQNRHLIDTSRGHLAVGWLVVQDLFTVLALVLLPPLATLLKGVSGEAVQSVDLNAVASAVGLTIGKLAAFVAVTLLIGQRAIPLILHYVANTGSRELFRLAVLSVALGAAFVAAELFGVSFALGAFFAGMVLSESPLSQRAAEESLPFRDAFAVLFFVSMGMLFNPAVLMSEPVPLLGTLAVVLAGNGGASFLMVRILRRHPADALAIGAVLAQIGEFSFILAGLGIGLGLLTADARDLILGASILSIFLNPFLFSLAESLRPKYEPLESGTAANPTDEELAPTALSDHAVLIGYGRVGEIVGKTLIEEGWKLLVIEDSANIVARLRGQGIEAIAGNAASERVLKAANIPRASLLVVAIPNGFEAGQIVHQARAANPSIPIIARAHFDAEVEHLKHHGADEVIMGEREIATAMLGYARKKKVEAVPVPMAEAAQ